MNATLHLFTEEGTCVGFVDLELPEPLEKALEKARTALRQQTREDRRVRHGLLAFTPTSFFLITGMTQGNAGNEDGVLN